VNIITISTNECIQFYENHNMTHTHKILHVSGLTGPSSGSTTVQNRQASKT